MNGQKPRRGRCLPEILVCLVGFAASVVPEFSYSDSVWGVHSFADKMPFVTDPTPGVFVTHVALNSPVAAAGLKEGDYLLAVSGKPVEFATLRERLHAIQSGETVTFDVKRNGADLQLVARAPAPSLEGVLVLDCQFVSAPVFLVLFLLLVATQPLEPPPLWREIVVTLGGLAVLVVAVVVELTRFIPWTIVRQWLTVTNGPPPRLHYSLLGVVSLAGLALAVLGAFSIRAHLVRKANRPPSLLPEGAGERITLQQGNPT
jgi:hypothetical protein